MGTATHADPDALLARFRASGAPRDLGELFDATSGDLYRVALATAPDAAAAEDAVQETFLAVIGAVTRWDPSRRAMPWLLGILRFKVARLRERARRPADGAKGGDEKPEAAAREIVDGDPEAAAQAWAEIERLDEPYRAVALLRWRYGLTPAEIAHVRGEAPGTTRSLLSRALERVRKTLKVLPAVMVFAGRPARGLDAVRADVVSAAAVAPRTIAVSGGSLGTRALIAAALVAAIGTAGYFALRPDPSPPRAATETADAALASATLAAPPARPITIGAPAAAPVAPIAGPSARGRVVRRVGTSDSGRRDLERGVRRVCLRTAGGSRVRRTGRSAEHAHGPNRRRRPLRGARSTTPSPPISSSSRRRDTRRRSPRPSAPAQTWRWCSTRARSGVVACSTRRGRRSPAHGSVPAS